MAKASPRTITDGVVLELTENEARTLAEILASVGGDPKKSARRYAWSMAAALRDAGYGFTRRPYGCTQAEKDAFFISGNIYFVGELPAAAGECSL